jgi:hypothetical protein
MKGQQNTISLADAQRWAANWRSNPSTTVKAFLIPGIDITELAAEGGQDVRAYLGMDDNGVAKLILVAVDSNGEDMVDEAKEHYIYDFTTPCPTTCDLKSPLYDLK